MMQSIQSTRRTNPLNKNQNLYSESTYHNLPLIRGHGEMIEEYLESLYRVTKQALADHPRTCAFRFDLRFPSTMDHEKITTSNFFISRFIESFKAKVRHNRNLAKENNPYAHDSRIRYVWTREVSQEYRIHYHVIFLLNRDAYFTLGNFSSSKPNTAKRLTEAWASALGISADAAAGLVHFPDNPVYPLEDGAQDTLAAFFHRASYLCKAKTKQFGEGHHGFGASRL